MTGVDFGEFFGKLLTKSLNSFWWW